MTTGSGSGWSYRVTAKSPMPKDSDCRWTTITILEWSGLMKKNLRTVMRNHISSGKLVVFIVKLIVSMRK